MTLCDHESQLSPISSACALSIRNVRPLYGPAQSFYANILLMHTEPQRVGGRVVGKSNKARRKTHTTLHQKLSQLAGLYP